MFIHRFMPADGAKTHGRHQGKLAIKREIAGSARWLINQAEKMDKSLKKKGPSGYIV
jgi:hypothetical protein